MISIAVAGRLTPRLQLVKDIDFIDVEITAKLEEEISHIHIQCKNPAEV